MIVGVDPGSKTGIAVVDRSRLLYCKQFPAAVARLKVVEIARSYEARKAAVEMPQQGAAYPPETVKKKAGVIKYLQNVGQNIALTYAIIDALEARRITVKPVSARPKRRKISVTGSTKWDVGTWTRIFDWDGRPPGEHARDAAIIAWLHENAVIIQRRRVCWSTHNGREFTCPARLKAAHCELPLTPTK